MRETFDDEDIGSIAGDVVQDLAELAGILIGGVDCQQRFRIADRFRHFYVVLLHIEINSVS